MRSRTVREGSVGLLFLVGLGLFAGLILWLRGFYFGRSSYNATIEFADAAGMDIGTPVRYRGVTIGKVTAIQPKPNGVDVQIQINQPDLSIPKNVKIEANRSGLIGSNSIDIIPSPSATVDVQGANPLDRNCNTNLIICNNARLEGGVGVSLDELIRSMYSFTERYNDEKFYNNLNTAVQNTSTAAQGITQLTREFSGLATSVKQDLNSVSSAANSVGRAADKFGGTADKLNQTVDQFSLTANQINATANRTASQFTTTANRITAITTQTANRVGSTADQFRVTATQAGNLVTNLNNLVTTNQSSLVATLDNLSQTSTQLRSVVNDLAPTVNRVAQGQLIQNLETLSANAAQASANLRDLSNTINSPTNLLVLQQTLDSARVTFQNAQKITSDLDELTGDPAFRVNLRNLVNGLSGLVSSTEQIQKQVEVAQFLTPMTEATNLEIPAIPSEFQMQEMPAISSPISIISPDFENKLQPLKHQTTTAGESQKPPR